MAFKPSNFSPDRVPRSDEINTVRKYTAFTAQSPSTVETLETFKGKNVEHFKPANVPF